MDDTLQVAPRPRRALRPAAVKTSAETAADPWPDGVLPPGFLPDALPATADDEAAFAWLHADPDADNSTGADPARTVASPGLGYQVDGGAITCAWTLADLPSPQHRAGLAGLALLVEFTRRDPLPPGAVLELQRLDDHGLTLRLDRAGLAALFDRVYAAHRVPAARRPRSATTTATAARGARTRYRAEAVAARPDPGAGADAAADNDQVVPDGGPLRDWAPPGGGGAWLRLWQHCLWSVLRAIPQQRWPYQVRARAGADPAEPAERVESPRDGGVPRDVAEAWAGLRADLPSRMASTHFLGAMDANAECVPFLDRGRRLFLLHFWPFAAHVFVPAHVSAGEGARARDEDDPGYILCIPDIVRLAAFVRLHPRVLRHRPAERAGWRPRAALVAHDAAAAAQAERWMREHLGPGWDGGADRITAGFQVIAAARAGNRVRLRANRMVDPTPALVDALAVADGLRSPHLRRLLLANALAERPWWRDGDRLCATLPAAKTIGDAGFRADLRMLFARSRAEAAAGGDGDGARALACVVAATVERWLAGRLAAGAGGASAHARPPAPPPDDADRRRRVAVGAFHAARRRVTTRDFTAWFVAAFGTLLTAHGPAPMPLVAALAHDVDHVRTLTLLALAAAP